MRLSRCHGMGLTMGMMVLVQAGCAKSVDSTDVRTSGLYAQFSASSKGDGLITVEAKLRVGDSGSSTYAELDGEDRLVASLNGDVRTLTKSDSSANSPYRAVFTTSSGGTLTIAFMRGPDDTSAPNSSVVIPSTFIPRFVGINPGDSVQRGQSISVAWNNASTGSIYWSVQGSCIKSHTDSAIDSGSLVVRGLDVQPNPQLYDPAVSPLARPDPTCDAWVGLRRGATGYVDPAFGEGGSFQATQSYDLLFRSAPGPDEPKLPTWSEGNTALDAGALSPVDASGQ
jgi:hypothetical protein